MGYDAYHLIMLLTQPAIHIMRRPDRANAEYKAKTMLDDTQLIPIVEILEELEALMDQAPSDDIERILLATWLKVSKTLPEDFLAATREDASAAGLRRYLRVKAFFDDPIQHPISSQELLDYQQHHLPIDEEKAEHFFLDVTDDKD